MKVIARDDLKSSDTRRWQSNPHIRVSIGYLEAVFDHLARHDVRMYRMSSDVAPYATHPDMPQFHGQIAEADADLRALGAKARAQGLRLSFHPSQYVLLNSPDEVLTGKSIADLSAQAEILDRMELDAEAVMVTHVGGVYGEPEASRARWAKRWETLPEHVRRRLVLEHDDIRFSAADVIWIHERTGVRLVFDHQHFWCLNPEGMALGEALRFMVRTWPAGQRPKVHFSTPRTEFRTVTRKDKRGKPKAALAPPIWSGHADFANPFEFARFMRDAADLSFDVMLEGKAKDVGVLRLRADLLRYAPDVAARFGLHAADAAAAEAEAEALVTDQDPAADADVDEGSVDEPVLG